MSITFADIFAGIGGFHLGLKRCGAKCSFISEKDSKCVRVYKDNFRDIDLKKINRDILQAKEIPDFDILCAGFPCQPFSILGNRLGLDDERAECFFKAIEIINMKRPKAFILENVKGILSVKKGVELEKIIDVLESTGYAIRYKEISAADFGVPQNRRRVFFVGIRDDIKRRFYFPNPIPLKQTLSDILGVKCDRDIAYTIRVGGASSGINSKYNWDSYRTENGIVKITLKDAIKIMGFPEDFIFDMSDSQAIKLLGNSVVPDVVEAISKNIIRAINMNN